MLLTFRIDRESPVAHYRQLADQLIGQIQQGYLLAGARLPSTRWLASSLGIHRKSVVRAYEELQLQDWVATRTGRGTFVAEGLPAAQPQPLAESASPAPALSFHFPASHHLMASDEDYSLPYHLDDGLPDPRLIPLLELERAQRTALRRGNRYLRLNYADPQGSLALREALADYLASSRGLRVGAAEILITRGVTQALFLCLEALLQPGDQVILPALNWPNGDRSFRYHGADILRARVDERGLDVEHVGELLAAHPGVKLIYLTPHHQYPTTVVMPAGRRIQLLELARRHGVFVFEDDYDYDFHYGGIPILPLASTDHGGRVGYAGSFTKAISPAFRLGYFVGDAALVAQMSRIRRVVDRMGDPLLEMSILELLRTDILPRSLRRARLVYQKRRDHLANLLSEELPETVRFRVPDGGMAIWAEFDGRIHLPTLRQRARTLGLGLAGGAQYASPLNATRLGFASSTEDELTRAVALLKEAVRTG